jgi:serine/threonine-protein kinase
VPPQLDELVLWATNRDPEQRPTDARMLLEKLYEVERAIHSGHADGDADATRVITPANNDELATTVLAPAAVPLVPAPTFAGPAAQVRSEATATDAVSKLAAVSRHRRGRGWWLFAALLVLAGLAGGTGWYFGAGPGALVAVPAVVDKPAAAAASALHDAELVTKQNPVYSCAVPEGRVTAVSPKPGRLLHKGSAVTLNVSRGHEPNQIPALGGLPLDQAKAAIAGAKSLVGTAIDSQFSSTVANGAVIAATKATDKQDITGGGAYTQCDTINLTVSVGAIPNVVGKPLADAQAALRKANLAYGEGQRRYDDNVPKGAVIAENPADSGPVHPGDTIVLDVSEGPQLFPVPDVTGMTPDDAKAALEKAGFTVTVPSTFSGLPITVFAPGMIVVSKESPDSTTQQRKGTNISLTLGLKG